MAVARVVRAFRPALRRPRNSWLQRLRPTTSAAEAIVLRALGGGPEGPHYPYERIHQSWNRYSNCRPRNRWLKKQSVLARGRTSHPSKRARQNLSLIHISEPT